MRAVIFDMDGVLIDSEPLWREAEIEVFATVGITLTHESCRETTGLRMDEVVTYRHREEPWPLEEVSIEDLAGRVERRLIEYVREKGTAMEGAIDAIDRLEDAGYRLALASSSAREIIDVVLDRLGLSSRFEVVASAETEAYGKPHPAVFLRVASALGVDPTECVVIEDSLNGVIAAKAARMGCVAVPEDRDDPRFAIADTTLTSLAEFFPSKIESTVG